MHVIDSVVGTILMIIISIVGFYLVLRFLWRVFKENVVLIGIIVGIVIGFIAGVLIHNALGIIVFAVLGGIAAAVVVFILFVFIEHLVKGKISHRDPWEPWD